MCEVVDAKGGRGRDNVEEPVELRTEVRLGDALVDMPVNHEVRSPAEEYRLERPTSQLWTPRVLLVAHRDVRGRVVGEEDPQVGSAEGGVEEGDLPPVQVL